MQQFVSQVGSENKYSWTFFHSTLSSTIQQEKLKIQKFTLKPNGLNNSYTFTTPFTDPTSIVIVGTSFVDNNSTTSITLKIKDGTLTQTGFSYYSAWTTGNGTGTTGGDVRFNCIAIGY